MRESQIRRQVSGQLGPNTQLVLTLPHSQDFLHRPKALEVIRSPGQGGSCFEEFPLATDALPSSSRTEAGEPPLQSGSSYRCGRGLGGGRPSSRSHCGGVLEPDFQPSLAGAPQRTPRPAGRGTRSGAFCRGQDSESVCGCATPSPW